MRKILDTVFSKFQVFVKLNSLTESVVTHFSTLLRKMYIIKAHNRIYQIVALLNFLNLWNNESETSYRVTFWKCFYLSFYISFTVSIGLGACNVEDTVDCTYSMAIFLVAFVATVRLIYILRTKTKIFTLLDSVCVYSTKYSHIFLKIDQKLTNFMKIITFLATFLIVALFFLIMSSAITRRLPFNVAFPLDWRQNGISYCITLGFITYGMIITAVGILFSSVVWYFMVNICIKYQVFSEELKKTNDIVDLIGAVQNHRKITR